MRRDGRKRGLRSNRTIKHCTSCACSYASRLNSKIEEHIAQEEQKRAEASAAEEEARKGANERKRLARKVQRALIPDDDPSEEREQGDLRKEKQEKNLSEEQVIARINAKAKAKANASMKAKWKMINKDFVIKVDRSLGAVIVGNIAHKHVMIDRSRYHNTYTKTTKKGLEKVRNRWEPIYKDRDVRETLFELGFY